MLLTLLKQQVLLEWPFSIELHLIFYFPDIANKHLQYRVDMVSCLLRLPGARKCDHSSSLTSVLARIWSFSLGDLLDRALDVGAKSEGRLRHWTLLSRWCQFPSLWQGQIKDQSPHQRRLRTFSFLVSAFCRKGVEFLDTSTTQNAKISLRVNQFTDCDFHIIFSGLFVVWFVCWCGKMNQKAHK